MTEEIQRFGFEFERAYRLPALAFGVRPSTAEVTVTPTHLLVHFGPWQVRTALFNIVSATVTGPYHFLKTAGPARLGITDRSLTFATNSAAGVELQFHAPIPGIEPTHRLRHPSLTVTVADCLGLSAVLNERKPR